VQLTDNIVAADPLLTPDGRYVVFLSTRDGTQSPWIVPTDGGEPTQVVRTQIGFGGRMDISPDGRRLMFVTRAAETDAPIVVLCELPDCADRIEIAGPQLFQPPFKVMPDGRAVAYLDATGTNIWALPLDGGAPRQITSFASDAPGAIVNYEWSPDGTQLALLRGSVTQDIVLLRGVQP